jgi:hypothetical protein
MMTNTYKVEDVNRAYQELQDGESIRRVVRREDLAESASAEASRQAAVIPCDEATTM